jgi:ribose-phosphate pyrophosphokinase
MFSKPDLILGFSDYEPQAKNLANALRVDYATVDNHIFPDGESKLTLPVNLPNNVVFYRSLDKPNKKLIELLIAAQTARELGASHLTLVAPYLCYMRQDIAFNPGEAVSQKIIGRFLAENFDALLTVDAHLHRVHDIREAVPAKQALNLCAARLIGDYVKAQIENPLFLGPDEESKQWVQAAAQAGNFDYAVAQKTRGGDRQVKITLPDFSFQRRNIIIIDDMASTGQTIIQTANLLRQHKAKAVHCAVTHALFLHEVTQHMRQAGIQSVWSTDSVTHPTNQIFLATALAAAFQR